MKTTRFQKIRIDDRKWCMEFNTTDSAYYIAVDSESELNNWLSILHKVEQKYFDISGVENQAPSKSTLTSLRGKVSLSIFPKKQNSSFEIGAPGGNSPTFVRKDDTQITKQDSPRSLTNSSATNNPRDAILQEILITERDYVSDLLIITDFYIKRLEGFKILKKDSKDVIFANVEDFVPLHKVFLQKLEEEFKNPNGPLISKIFISEVIYLIIKNLKKIFLKISFLKIRYKFFLCYIFFLFTFLCSILGT